MESSRQGLGLPFIAVSNPEEAIRTIEQAGETKGKGTQTSQ
ncbi:MAG: hypothetical protein RMK89_01365 [Armatimonadota bacterium]|nr:hypothetical protein [Armatimonadota bacterium]MDW8142087.1 hypothetical protein [Armatimonadota bacterium]